MHESEVSKWLRSCVMNQHAHTYTHTHTRSHTLPINSPPTVRISLLSPLDTLTGEIEGDPMATDDPMDEPSQRDLAGMTGSRSRGTGDQDILSSSSSSEDELVVAESGSGEGAPHPEGHLTRRKEDMSEEKVEKTKRKKKEVDDAETMVGTVKDPYAKAKQRNEDRKLAIEQREQEKKDRKQRNRESIQRRRRERAFLQQRSRRGQPVMKNVVRHLLTRIEKKTNTPM
jgi:rRNA processing